MSVDLSKGDIACDITISTYIMADVAMLTSRMWLLGSLSTQSREQAFAHRWNGRSRGGKHVGDRGELAARTILAPASDLRGVDGLPAVRVDHRGLTAAHVS